MLKSLFRVSAQLFVVVGAGGLCFLPRCDDMTLRCREMRVSVCVDIFHWTLRNGHAGQNQQSREDAAPQELRFHL